MRSAVDAIRRLSRFSHLQIAAGTLMLLHTAAVYAGAQEQVRVALESLTPGDPVRAFASALRKNPCQGRFDAVRSDSLVIRAGRKSCGTPLYALERVDLRTDRESDAEAIQRGALWGAGVPAGFIYVLCGVTACYTDGMAWGIVNGVAAIVAVPGAIVGGLVAVANPKGKWQHVWLRNPSSP